MVHKPSQQKLITSLAIIVIVLLLLSSVYIYNAYFLVKEQVQENLEETHQLDDRISPLENQGVVLEVLRLRHRGLLDKLLKPGNSWKTKPTFYFITTMDGLEYKSKDVSSHGLTTEIMIHTWDTMFQENKIMKDCEEEQETSTVTLTIVEQVKSGLLGRKTTSVERDSLTVTYDYRTGRWTGDDSFNDYDGYGHYLGDTFEIWFNLYQIDVDDDYIPYWTEVNILGTDPMMDDSKLDPDNDSIPTAWEWKWGYDPFSWDNHRQLDPDMDGLENTEEYQMAKWFANPFIQDIYYEVDVMGTGGFNDPPHYLFEESKQGVIERFAEHNIRVYIDDGWPNGPTNGGGDLVPHVEKISQDSGMMLQYYNTYFPAERRGVFRYFVIGHGGGFNHPSKNNVYDTTQVSYQSAKIRPLNKIWLFLLLGQIPTERGMRISLGAVLLHEMSHSCSVDADNCAFEGIDNYTVGSLNLYIETKWDKNWKNTWGQYKSVLNYYYCHTLKLFDLSDGTNGPPYDQNDWGYIFVGHFQYNANLIEEPYYEPQAGETLVTSEWRVTGYTYDENLTEQFKKTRGDYSPISPIPVNWSVYKRLEKNPSAKDIKIFAQPDIKTTRQWVLVQEGDLDSEGNIQFYSYDKILEGKLT